MTSHVLVASMQRQQNCITYGCHVTTRLHSDIAFNVTIIGSQQNDITCYIATWFHNGISSNGTIT
uniref:Uncharacterized protein n=1 Tax=Arion vulgaris TaxID=1028688 RepID=A0A0B7AZN0_9EUPU